VLIDSYDIWIRLFLFAWSEKTVYAVWLVIDYSNGTLNLYPCDCHTQLCNKTWFENKTTKSYLLRLPFDWILCICAHLVFHKNWRRTWWFLFRSWRGLTDQKFSNRWWCIPHFTMPFNVKRTVNASTENMRILRKKSQLKI